MKNLIKNEICGSVNSTQMHCSRKIDEKLRLLFIYSVWTVAACGGKRVQQKKKKRKEKTQEIKLNKTQRVSKHWHNLHWNLLLEFVLGGDYARGVEEKFSEPSNYSWWAGQHGLEVLWNKTKQKQIGYQSIMSYFFNLSFTATIAFFFFFEKPTTAF